MTQPTDTIEQELIAAAPEERPRLKAELIERVIGNIWPADGVLSWSRGSGAAKRTIVIDKRPALIRNRAGRIVGIDAYVRVFRGTADVEIPVDPHRIFVNPALKIPDGTTRQILDAFGRPLVVSRFVVDPRAALEEALRQSILDAPNAAGWRTAGTVTTFFSDTADGRVNSNSATYSSARSGTALSATTAETAVGIGQDFGTFVGGQYYCLEGFLGFDTSSIPDADVVRKAILSLALQSDSSTTDFTVNAHLKDWGVSVTTADWIAGASIAAQTLLATLATSGLVAGYNAFAENGATFAANVNKTGFTRLMLSSSRHSGNNTPTGAEFAYFYFADEAGTTNDPKLVVTHGATGTRYKRSGGVPHLVPTPNLLGRSW